jgi:DNA-binding XRE family transcriptional regulator
MDQGSAHEFGRRLDVIASRGEPRVMVIPSRVWRRLPTKLRKRLDDVDTIVRGTEITARLVPLRRYSTELREAVEDVLDIELAESVDEAIADERVARARVGAREPGIPAEVLRAELEGAHPIAAWRKHRGLTQLQLAAAAGIDRGYLALIERGARSGSAPTLTRIARALGCMLDDLVAAYEAAGD